MLDIRTHTFLPLACPRICCLPCLYPSLSNDGLQLMESSHNGGSPLPAHRHHGLQGARRRGGAKQKMRRPRGSRSFQEG